MNTTDTAREEEKQFPIQRPYRAETKPYPLSIPWSVAELAYSVYISRYGSSQPLERLAERGGFHVLEMDELLPDWRERCDELAKLKAERDELKRQVGHMRERIGWVVKACEIDRDAKYELEGLL
jgi:hypothetical protein